MCKCLTAITLGQRCLNNRYGLACTFISYADVHNAGDAVLYSSSYTKEMMDMIIDVALESVDK